MKTRVLMMFVMCSAMQLPAQDPLFTQNTFGLSMINPAFAGSMACTRAEIGYRTHSISDSFNVNTMNVTYDLYSTKAGIMLNYLRDDQNGMIVRDRIDLNCTYGYGIGQDEEGKSQVVIQPGIQVSYYRTNVPEQTVYPAIYDLRYGKLYPPYTGYSYQAFDLSAGILINSRFAMGGFSVYHLTGENAALWDTEAPLRWTLHAAFILGNKDADSPKLSIIPSFVFLQQNDESSFTGMILAKYYGFRLGIGTGAIENELPVILCGYTFRKMTLSYSYEPSLENAYGTVHEFHFSYLLFTKKWSLGLLNTQAFF